MPTPLGTSFQRLLAPFNPLSPGSTRDQQSTVTLRFVDGEDDLTKSTNDIGCTWNQGAFGDPEFFRLTIAIAPDGQLGEMTVPYDRISMIRIFPDNPSGRNTINVFVHP